MNKKKMMNATLAVSVLALMAAVGAYAAFTISASGSQTVSIPPAPTSATITLCNVNGVAGSCTISGDGLSASLTLPTLTAAGEGNTINLQVTNGPTKATLTITPSSSDTSVATISGPTSLVLTAGQTSATLPYIVTAVANGTTTIAVSISG